MDMGLQIAGPLASEERVIIGSVVWSHGSGQTGLHMGPRPSSPFPLSSPACYPCPEEPFPKSSPSVNFRYLLLQALIFQMYDSESAHIF